MFKFKTLGLVLLISGTRSFAAQNTPDLSDLEFYISTINCFTKYITCKNTIQTTNPNIDCLQWGSCNHIKTLEALIQIPYVQQSILTSNSDISKSVNDILSKYGKDALIKLVDQYNIANITNILNDLIIALEGTDLTALGRTGLYPVPNPY